VKARNIQQEQVFNRGTRDPRLNDNRIKGPEHEKIKQAIITKIQDELFGVILQPKDQYQALNEESRNYSNLFLTL
jgi:hypothetical protein